MTTKISDHFKLEEFVPPETLDYFKAIGSSATRVLDKDIILGVEKIRRWFGKPIIINNWSTGGQFKYRCFRPVSCKEGSVNGEHRYGRAIDFDVSGLNSLEVQAEIIKNWGEFSPFFQGIEQNTIGWTHLCKMWITDHDNKAPIIIPIPK